MCTRFVLSGGAAAGMLFKGFDIPLQVLTGEKFEQPILFGANNLSGIVQTNVAYAGRWHTLQRPHAVGRRAAQAPRNFNLFRNRSVISCFLFFFVPDMGVSPQIGLFDFCFLPTTWLAAADGIASTLSPYSW